VDSMSVALPAALMAQGQGGAGTKSTTNPASS
jgi:hypothetical protein